MGAAHPLHIRTSTLGPLSTPRSRADAQALAHCSRHCLRSFTALAYDRPGKSPVLSTRTSGTDTGVFAPQPQSDTYAPKQGEVGGPKVGAGSAGIPGRRAAEALVRLGRWETPPPGAGPGAPLSVPAPPSVPLREHTRGLKGPQRLCPKVLQPPGYCLQSTGFSRQEASAGSTMKTTAVQSISFLVVTQVMVQRQRK